MVINNKRRIRSENDLRMLSKEVIEEIFKLADSPEYRHGTGCRDYCPKCPGNGYPIIYRISVKLGIGECTVKQYLEPEYRVQVRERCRKHLYTEIGKETRERYYKSKEWSNARKRYEKSEKGKISTRKRTEKWRKNKNLKKSLLFSNQLNLSSPAIFTC